MEAVTAAADAGVVTRDSSSSFPPRIATTITSTTTTSASASAAPPASAYVTVTYYSSDDDENDSIPERTTATATGPPRARRRHHHHSRMLEGVVGDTDSDWGGSRGSSDDGRMSMSFEAEYDGRQDDDDGNDNYSDTADEEDLTDDDNDDDDDDEAAQEILMSEADIEICQRLDYEYELALDEREIAYSARFQSVRQSACLSIVFMLLFLTLAPVFFLQQAEDWNVADSVLFSIYTITTVGYGHLEHPETAAFQLYTIFFIFIGIATLTIMVAQIYQCLALEASRAQHSRDRRLFGANGSDVITRHSVAGATTTASTITTTENATTSTANTDPSHQQQQTQQQHQQSRSSSSSINNMLTNTSMWMSRRQQQFFTNHNLDEIVQQHSQWIDLVWHCFDSSRNFFAHNEIGRSLSILFPFLGLIFMGAIVVGPIEGWGLVESLYFSVVSLTTVGFGDYYPTRTASIWFCILWLPCSVGFMSLFLANVAAFYIRLSDKNISRIERQLRKHVARAKAQAERELQEARRRALRGQEIIQQQQQHDHAAKMESSSSHTSATTTTKVDTSATTITGSSSIELPAVPFPRVGGSQQHRPKKPGGFDTVPTTEEQAHHHEDDHDDIDYSDHHAALAVEGDEGEVKPAGAAAQSHNSRTTATTELFGSSNRSPRNRREMILRNCRRARRFVQPVRSGNNQSGRGAAAGSASPDDKSTASSIRPSKPTMATMRDVLRTVRRQMAQDGGFGAVAGPESEFLSIRSTRTVRHRLESYSASTSATTTLRKPSFALRALVQERFSEIIATEIAGYSTNIEIHDNTLTVTIDSLRQTADKWLIPRRARKAFRAVCFETLFFVGEHGLIVRGADALYDLTPIEFHGLFAPLLAAMGDAETMEGWLASTEVLAEVDLKNDAVHHQRRGLSRRPQKPSSPQRRGDGRREPGRQARSQNPNSPSRELMGGSTRNKPAKQLATPGNAFAAANRSMRYA